MSLRSILGWLRGERKAPGEDHSRQSPLAVEGGQVEYSPSTGADGVSWADSSDEYRDATIVWPWSDSANFALVDIERDVMDEAVIDQLYPVRTGDASGTERWLRRPGLVVPVATGEDGQWKVAVQMRDAPPTLDVGSALALCPLRVASGRVIVHCPFQIPDCVDREAGLETETNLADHVVEVRPGDYLVRVTRTEFPDGDYLEDDRDAASAPHYLVDLWPDDGETELHWSRPD